MENKAPVSGSNIVSGSGSTAVVPEAPKVVKEAPKEKKVEVPVVALKDPLYKLNFRRPNGQIRADIPKSLVYTLVTHYADLLRLISSNRWTTMNEIVDLVWEWERRNNRQKYNRTRVQIERGVTELVEAGVVLIKA